VVDIRDLGSTVANEDRVTIRATRAGEGHIADGKCHLFLRMRAQYSSKRKIHINCGYS